MASNTITLTKISNRVDLGTFVKVLTQRIMKIQGIFTFQEILQSLRPQGSNHCKVQVSSLTMVHCIFCQFHCFLRKGGSAATDMGPLILFLLTKMALAKVPHPYQEAEDFSPEDAEDAGAISEGKVVPKEKVKSC